MGLPSFGVQIDGPHAKVYILGCHTGVEIQARLSFCYHHTHINVQSVIGDSPTDPRHVVFQGHDDLRYSGQFCDPGTSRVNRVRAPSPG